MNAVAHAVEVATALAKGAANAPHQTDVEVLVMAVAHTFVQQLATTIVIRQIITNAYIM